MRLKIPVRKIFLNQILVFTSWTLPVIYTCVKTTIVLSLLN